MSYVWPMLVLAAACFAQMTVVEHLETPAQCHSMYGRYANQWARECHEQCLTCQAAQEYRYHETRVVFSCSVWESRAGLQLDYACDVHFDYLVISFYIILTVAMSYASFLLVLLVLGIIGPNAQPPRLHPVEDGKLYPIPLNIESYGERFAPELLPLPKIPAATLQKMRAEQRLERRSRDRGELEPEETRRSLQFKHTRPMFGY
ncbi:MAG: hypothetical protein MHM6MM_003141 [Cercozoa sp. M6MM]